MTNVITWHQAGDFERFQINATRFGLFTSVTESGESMVTGLTYDSVLAITPMHQEANSPGYDGRYDLSTHAANKVVDL